VIGRFAMSAEPARETIARRLRTNEVGIDEAIFREVRASVPDAVVDDPEYESELYGAVVGAIRHCLNVIEVGGEAFVPLPAATIEQARRAARRGVGIEKIVHRVALGERMVRAFAMREAEDLPARDLSLVLGPLDAALDLLVEAVTKAYEEERARLSHGPDGHRLELIERLLAGERPGPTDEAVLGYRLWGWHLGVSGTGGTGTEEALRQIADSEDCSLLIFRRDESVASGWLGGGQRRIDFDDLRRQPAINRCADAAFVVGEPGEGLEGWRRTHEQARLAQSPGIDAHRRLARAADVLPEAILSRDRMAARLLVATYLEPLEGLRGSGGPARETLRAHFANGRSVSAAATALQVARGTVEHRLREVESATGRSLSHEHMTRLEIALRVEEELRHLDGKAAPS
jgi:hypothetical protein